jgi:pimeloyl-ACP methyl ester carboxylesterase
MWWEKLARISSAQSCTRVNKLEGRLKMSFYRQVSNCAVAVRLIVWRHQLIGYISIRYPSLSNVYVLKGGEAMETVKTMIKRSLLILTLLSAVHTSLPVFAFGQTGIKTDAQAAAGTKDTNEAQGKYAEVNGLKIYYEIHGSGQPLVLLHGAFGFNEGWAPLLPAFTKTHQVIAIELQGHGHTNDVDRPLSYEQMADDTAALLAQLKVKEADFFGYSMGGTVALGVAIRHPELVRKLAVLGSTTGSMKETFEPESYKQFLSLPADFAPPILKQPYDRMSPDPSRWPVLVTKIKNLGRDFKGYSAADVKSIRTQVLIMLGDRDGTRPEHAVEMYRQISKSQLAIFPGEDHFIIFSNPDKVLSVLIPFLDAPIKVPRKIGG